MSSFWTAANELPTGGLLLLATALLVAFAFEFINGFHDTANAVATVIYTRTLPATAAVVYSGIFNFLGVLLGGTGVAFGIVNLLPVDLLVNANSNAALVMVLSLLLAGVTWNLLTWYQGLPVSSSHTLIGSILGVGVASSLWAGTGLSGVNWTKAAETGLFLFITPVIGFVAGYALLAAMKVALRDPRLHQPPVDGDHPPGWIRGVLIATCGGVSFAHGTNDGQKGMGLLLLVLIGFLPAHYALNTNTPTEAADARAAVGEVRAAFAGANVPLPGATAKDLDYLDGALAGRASFGELANETGARWEVRQAIHRVVRGLKATTADAAAPDGLKKALKGTAEKPGPQPRLTRAVEFVPFWVVVGTALALGLGTMVGYKRIVITVAEKIGRGHMTYSQGAVAGTVAAVTILAADTFHAPVSTTQILSSGVAGTMVANGSGVQGGTVRRIVLAWCLTLPASALLAAALFSVGRVVAG